jgi:hypothetical protein
VPKRDEVSVRTHVRAILALASALAVGWSTTRSISHSRRQPNPPLVRVRDCEGPATSLSPVIAALLPRRDGSMQPDDYWADLAKEVPGGFAGGILSNGQPVLLLTDTTKAAEAKQALAPKLHLSNFDVSAAAVRPARWDFDQLVDWYNYLIIRSNFWWGVGITSGDKSESLNRIHFGVEDEGSRARLVEKLDGLDVPCDLIVVGVEGRAVLAPAVLPPQFERH